MGLLSFLKNKFSRKDKTLDKYAKGMEKSNKNFSCRLDNLSHKYKRVNEDYFEELEEVLFEADVGVNLALSIIQDVLEESKKLKIYEPEQINSLLIDRMFKGYMDKGEENKPISFIKGTPTVILVVGVNGVGKTTSIAKLASKYVSEGKKTLLVAADTFRAGATEQLSIWANRLGVDIVTGGANADPASLAYDGVRKARLENYDLVIIDTAGRLQTKDNLMLELAKIRRVIAKEIVEAPQETLLIIDATTGQNGVVQAKAFKEVTPVSGVVITKMDGTSKGGIILAIREELGIPVKFIGLGEGLDDLEEFDLYKYLYGLCVGEENE